MSAPREQVPGWSLWLEQRTDGWYVVDARGEPRSFRALKTREAALREIGALTDTSGT